MREQDIQRMFKRFFNTTSFIFLDFDKNAKDNEDDNAFLKKLKAHPDFSLDTIKEAFERRKCKITYEQFEWIFCQLSLGSQLEVLKESLVKIQKAREERCTLTVFDEAVEKAVENWWIFYCLNLRRSSAASWVRVFIQRGFLYASEFYKENDEFDGIKMGLLTVFLIEAATKENHPVRIFFESVERSLGAGRDFFGIDMICSELDFPLSRPHFKKRLGIFNGAATRTPCGVPKDPQGIHKQFS